ncbi:unnamed protein product, partial [Protopolystoma xenopodis]
MPRTCNCGENRPLSNAPNNNMQIQTGPSFTTASIASGTTDDTGIESSSLAASPILPTLSALQFGEQPYRPPRRSFKAHDKWTIQDKTQPPPLPPKRSIVIPPIPPKHPSSVPALHSSPFIPSDSHSSSLLNDPSVGSSQLPKELLYQSNLAVPSCRNRHLSSTLESVNNTSALEARDFKEPFSVPDVTRFNITHRGINPSNHASFSLQPPRPYVPQHAIESRNAFSHSHKNGVNRSGGPQSADCATKPLPPIPPSVKVVYRTDGPLPFCHSNEKSG